MNSSKQHLKSIAAPIFPLTALAALALFGCKYEISWEEVPSRHGDSASNHRFWVSNIIQKEHIDACRADKSSCGENISKERQLAQFCHWLDSEPLQPEQAAAMNAADSYRCAFECRTDQDCEFFDVGAKCKNHVCDSHCEDKGTSFIDRGDGCCVSQSAEADENCPENNNGNNGGNNTSETPTGPLPNEDKFVDIPGGILTFQYPITLNSTPYTNYNAGDTVRISEFHLWKTPVTVAEYKQCVAAGACAVEAYTTNGALCNYNEDDRQNHPMNCLSPLDAKNFCQWTKARLPTMEEWVYAATHDGTQPRNTEYPWGNSFPTHCRTANFYAVQPLAEGTQNFYCFEHTEVASPAGTSPVGTYSPEGDSPLGLVDMLGNVWEIVNLSNTNYIIGVGFDTPMVENENAHYLTKLSYYGIYAYKNNAGFRCAR